MAKTYYVYILASRRNGTLYIGVTSDIAIRADQHRSGTEGSFTKKYSVNDLVYFEQTSSVESAISREKQLKHWNRSWKIKLIEKSNPKWKDLSNEF